MMLIQIPGSFMQAVLEEEQTILCVCHDPGKTFLKIKPGHGRASHDLPPMCLDAVQLKCLVALVPDLPVTGNGSSSDLADLFLAHGTRDITFVLEHQQTGA